MTLPQDLTRRGFLRAAALAGAGLILPSGLATACATPGRASTATGWDAVPGILARIRPPVFPDRDFPITAHGAVGDGRTDASRAIAAAVAACAAAGGGRVVVSPPRAHALGGDGADGLLAPHLRLRAAGRRDHGRGHARRAGRQHALVAVERAPAVRLAEKGSPTSAPPAPGSSRWPSAARPWPSASSARIRTCARSSSSPTAAATCSSRA
jgi:hypothetical protein